VVILLFEFMVSQRNTAAEIVRPNVELSRPVEAGGVSPGCDDAPRAAARAYDACRSGSARAPS
jgi:hypothetical protein